MILIKIRSLKSKLKIRGGGARRRSVKKLLLEISQNPQENTCARENTFIKKETSA